MNRYDLMLRRGEYSSLYEELNREGVVYTLENLCSHFKKFAAKDIFYYVIYAISREDTVDRYITACEILEYLDQFVDDNYSLVRWLVSKGISTINDSSELKKWVVETYYSSPCGPLKKEEMLELARDILTEDFNHEKSIELLRSLDIDKIDNTVS